ncbi:hypothetical protein K8Z61_06665 [Nocardioides sp. TRM66260-LWL]|uniref:hypothetical protein n=1 Tax=Nocardioides sp. TRM66260-LWL TaxID=2874478 RepID=UPI001CC6F714|nr:hypothetical protein [Nocardioides sp. TRM66260-LWL]MBZ5734174.1 hypothetical protein [Nocardioides sp. TRM66260-LWL]
MAALVAALLASLAPGSAEAAPTTRRYAAWAPAASAVLTPGTQAYTDGAQCTSNFVFTDSRGDVYLGYSAHCAGKGESTDTDGCKVDSVPLGTKVTFAEGGSPVADGTVLATGRLAYSSWITMRRLGTKDANTCAYNDFALVKVARKDRGKVNPSVPQFGGPVAAPAAKGVVLAAGDQLYSYGNSSLRGGAAPFSPKYGVALGDDAADGGWSHGLYSLTPGIPGDSGSGFLDAKGRAIGTLSTVGLAPLPLSNNIGDLGRELAFAQKHSGIPGLRLALGTEPFTGAGLPGGGLPGLPALPGAPSLPLP